jgi:hypothetical protein
MNIKSIFAFVRSVQHGYDYPLPKIDNVSFWTPIESTLNAIRRWPCVTEPEPNHVTPGFVLFPGIFSGFLLTFSIGFDYSCHS